MFPVKPQQQSFWKNSSEWLSFLVLVTVLLPLDKFNLCVVQPLSLEPEDLKGPLFDCPLSTLSTDFPPSPFLKNCLKNTFYMVKKKSKDHSIPSQDFMANRWGKKWKQWQKLFSWAPKSLWMMTAARKLKGTCSLEEKLWQTYTVY